MGRQKAFIEIPRIEAGNRPVLDRIKDFSEVEQTLNSTQRREQATRCMDCGVPFCHWACPLSNKDCEWNNALADGDWKHAYQLLNTTNDFPEFTGRVCPASCEKACVLNLTLHSPVTNRENEAAITEMAWREGYILPQSYPRNNHRVAVIGAGPAGLTAANQLNKKGYSVTVFDKNEAPGGLLRYGIPNFKLNKIVIDRRIALLEEEGIKFITGIEININNISSLADANGTFDAIIIATGTPIARDLTIPGRELQGVHLALEMLAQQNRLLAGEEITTSQRVTAKGKNVIVIGGGDTGSDCIGTAHRQGCRSVTQLEIMPKPIDAPDDPDNPWPLYPHTLKTSSSHEEGCTRRWNINTLEFIGTGNHLSALRIQPITWHHSPDSAPTMTPAGPEEIIPCEMALLALGFIKTPQPNLPPNAFLAGDITLGPSLVARAMASGRKAAIQLDQYINSL